MEFDIIPIMALMIPLVVVVGITVRLTVKPVIEAMAKYRELQGTTDTQFVASLERRVAAVEQHLEGLDRSVGALEAESDFRRQLESGAASEPGHG